MFYDINGLEIDNFNPQVANAVKAAVFCVDVSGMIVRNSIDLECSMK